MSAKHLESPAYRKLSSVDTDAFCAHLLRLDRENRRLRFGHAVSDAFIRTYTDVAASLGGVVHGCFIDGTLRAAAELRPVSELMPKTAEAAFSVERDFQNAGIGSALLRRTVRSAQNRGVRSLVMYCLLENGRMRAVAAKHRAVLAIEEGEVIGEVAPPVASPLSVMRESMADTLVHLEGLFDVSGRPGRA